MKLLKDIPQELQDKLHDFNKRIEDLKQERRKFLEDAIPSIATVKVGDPLFNAETNKLAGTVYSITPEYTHDELQDTTFALVVNIHIPSDHGGLGHQEGISSYQNKYCTKEELIEKMERSLKDLKAGS